MFGLIWIILVFVTTTLLKVAKLQYFSLASCCQTYRVTEEALIVETAVWPIHFFINMFTALKKVQVGKDQEKAQSEKDSHSKNRGGKKTKLTIRHLYHETYRKPSEQLFSQ